MIAKNAMIAMISKLAISNHGNHGSPGDHGIRLVRPGCVREQVSGVAVLQAEEPLEPLAESCEAASGPSVRAGKRAAGGEQAGALQFVLKAAKLFRNPSDPTVQVVHALPEGHARWDQSYRRLSCGER